MKKIICLFIVMIMLSTQVFAATYYDVNVEGLTYSEKENLIEWLEDEKMEYDVESYTSNSSSSSNSKTKELEVEKLSKTEKNTLVTWLENRDYDYSSNTKNGYYYITVEYDSNKKSTLLNYLDNKGYDYDISTSSSSRNGNAYLIANGYLWYAEGSDIEKVDTIYSSEYVLFTKDGGLAYINNSKKGMYIEDMNEPTDSEQIIKSAKSIETNSSGYAISFKASTNSKATKIETDNLDNDEMTVYIVKSNTLYSLSYKNKLTKLKSLKSVSTSSNYAKNNSNIGFSEWGDLVFIDSSGVCFYNEEIDDTDEIQTLKDQNNYTVQAKYLTLGNGIIKTLTLIDSSVVKLEDD